MRKILAGVSALSLLAAAASLSALALLPAWDAVLNSNRQFLTWNHEITLLAGTVGLAGLFWVLLLAMRRGGKLFYPALSILMLAAFLLGPDLADYLGTALTQRSFARDWIAEWDRQVYGAAATLLLLAVLFAFARPKRTVELVLGARQVLSPLPLVLAAQLGFDIADTSPRGSAWAAGAAKVERTVVWLIFDELDKEMLARRTQALPAFRGLMERGLVATNAFPPGNMTRDSVPSMLLGTPLHDTDYLREGMLYRRRAEGPWMKLSDSDNVFRMLTRAGHRVSVTGWNLAYCNSFPSIADCADDTPYQTPGGQVGLWNWLFGSNWLARKLAYDDFNRQVSAPEIYAEIFFNWHYRNIRLGHMLNSMEASFLNAVHSRNYGLIYAHLPVPHLPRVDWRTGAHNDINLLADYDFNLKYCDALLQRVLAALDSAGYSNGYVLLITSDHWYRSLDWLQQGRAQVWPKARRSVPLLVYSSRESNAAAGTAVEKSFNTSGLGPVVGAMVMNQAGTYAQIAALLENLQDHDTVFRNF